jgi:aldose 1-epimerase
MSSYEVVDAERDGLAAIALVSREHDLRAEFVPAAGMVGASLTHLGEELLGQRGGLTAYRERGSTFGIPLLYPWANRLAGADYVVSGRRVELSPERSPVRLDPNGLPIHGVLAASRHWAVGELTADAHGATLQATLDYAAHPELMAAFPFPHELAVEARLGSGTLTIATVVRPTGELAVPVAFGWHPYLRLPGTPRRDWRVELPVRAQAVLDEHGIPTGSVDPAVVEPAPLGGRTYDHLFTELAAPRIFALEDARRRIEVEFGEAYPVAQVFAPPAADLICFEPMTAPTNALVSGDGLRSVPPGESFQATFRIRVLAT